jgi:hypothetical protein
MWFFFIYVFIKQGLPRMPHLDAVLCASLQPPYVVRPDELYASFFLCSHLSELIVLVHRVVTGHTPEARAAWRLPTVLLQAGTRCHSLSIPHLFKRRKCN